VKLLHRYDRWVGLDAWKLKVGHYLFDRHGGTVVFTGRFVTALRAGLLWSAGWAFGAYALGSAATRAGSIIMMTGLAATAATEHCHDCHLSAPERNQHPPIKRSLT